MLQDIEFTKRLAEILAHSIVFFARNEAPAGSDPVNADSPHIPKLNKQISSIAGSYKQFLPELLAATTSAIGPQQRAELAAAQEVAPGYNALQNALLGQYGAQASSIGDLINAASQRSQASSEASIAGGPGTDLARNLYGAYTQAEPIVAPLQQQAGSKLAELLGGGLTGSERAEIERALGRENAPQAQGSSAIRTVENASRFGEAGRNRLSQALQLTSQALPALRSGVFDTASVTGRNLQPNLAATKFVGTPDVGSSATAFGENFLNSISGIQNQRQQLNANRQTGFSAIMGSLPDY